MSEYTIVNGELYHYGVPGMKWGVRRATKLLSKATTKEDRDKAIASLNKHRTKATAKIEKLNKKSEKLQKRLDDSVRINLPREASLRSRAALIRNKKYGLFVSQSKANKLERKASKLENEANYLKAATDKARYALASNKRMIQLFETGVNNIDKTLTEAGKRFVND